MSNLSAVIQGVKDAVAADPANANAVFTNEGTLVGITEVDLKSGKHSFKVDEPGALGGTDLAGNPVEYTLASLGACQAITYRFWAEHLGVELDSVQVRTEADLDVRGFFGIDDKVRPGLGAVRVEVRLSGPEPKERYEALHKAVDDHCPILDTISNPVPVTTTLITG